MKGNSKFRLSSTRELSKRLKFKRSDVDKADITRLGVRVLVRCLAFPVLAFCVPHTRETLVDVPVPAYPELNQFVEPSVKPSLRFIAWMTQSTEQYQTNHLLNSEL